MPLLRAESPRSPGAMAGLVLAAVVGGLAASLVLLGNPGNMGLCGACFLRDTAGSLGLFPAPAPRIFRPEVVGVAVGALLYRVFSSGFQARSGSFAVSRLVLGAFMGIGALVFLGCPFRMLQRIGGGDLNAVVGAVGLVLGVGTAVQLEKRGYTVGKTSPVGAAVGLVGPFILVLLFALFVTSDVLVGPGPGDSSGPPHASFLVALSLAGVGGALLSATGFCAISATRQVFQKGKLMLMAAGLLVAGYALVNLVGGAFRLSFGGQPIAHGDHLSSILALYLVGLTGALAGGCPVRQIVMAGEGNGDAFVTVLGILMGGALAHTLGLASSGAGATTAGLIAVVLGIVASLVYGGAITLGARRAAP